jgi:hypothetical protein
MGTIDTTGLEDLDLIELDLEGLEIAALDLDGLFSSEDLAAFDLLSESLANDPDLAALIGD